jgi:hypothetical protein
MANLGKRAFNFVVGKGKKDQREEISDEEDLHMPYEVTQ